MIHPFGMAHGGHSLKKVNGNWLEICATLQFRTLSTALTARTVVCIFCWHFGREKFRLLGVVSDSRATEKASTMDVIFNCTHCDQELSVDAAGAGTVIDCPSCGGKLVIPQPGAQEHRPVNPIATSAAAKEEKHFAVPVHDSPTESLINKPLPPLEVAAKE